MIYGYVSITLTEQHHDEQRKALTAYGVDKIFEDNQIINRYSRKHLSDLLSLLEPGDTLAVHKIRYLGYSTKKLLEMAEYFSGRGIHFVSLGENIDTGTPVGYAVLASWCALLQLDRDILLEQTQTISMACSRSRPGGRPSIPPSKIQKALKLYFSDLFSIQEIADILGMSRGTIYKYLSFGGQDYERQGDP